MLVSRLKNVPTGTLAFCSWRGIRPDLGQTSEIETVV
jgi:hypothetical protein